MADFSFGSVGDFLKAVNSAKAHDRQTVSDRLATILDDQNTVSVPPSMSFAIDDLQERHGDETFRSIAMFCLGKWMETHHEIMQQHLEHGDMEAALWAMNDISKLSLVLRTIDETGSFGGDDSWRKMVKETVTSAVLDSCAERGISPEDVLMGEE
jgi:hypothetical protein